MEESRDLDKYTQELLAAMFCIIRIEVVEGKIFVEGDKNKISIQRETQMRRRLNFLDNTWLFTLVPCYSHAELSIHSWFYDILVPLCSKMTEISSCSLFKRIVNI